MSLNQNLANEADRQNVFESNDHRSQMEKNLTEDPLNTQNSLKSLANLKAPREPRRESVSYTLQQDIKEGITDLARQNGFSSTSRYVEAIFTQILGK